MLYFYDIEIVAEASHSTRPSYNIPHQQITLLLAFTSGLQHTVVTQTILICYLLNLSPKYNRLVVATFFTRCSIRVC